MLIIGYANYEILTQCQRAAGGPVVIIHDLQPMF